LQSSSIIFKKYHQQPVGYSLHIINAEFVNAGDHVKKRNFDFKKY